MVTERPGRLRIGVVGAGRVGAVVAAALRRAGHHVVAASGVSDASRNRIDVLLPGVPRRDVDQVVAAADLVLLTVPDDALAEVTGGLAQVGAWRAGQLAVHCCGTLGLTVLEPATRLGVVPMAIHPAMTFTGTSVDLDRLAGATCAVTAPPAFLPIAQALAVEMGGEPVVVPDEVRPLYHAALAHAANHTATVLAQATQLLSAAGIDEPGRVLSPLVHAAVDGALSDVPGTMASLTGPVVRGDVGTVQAHLAALANHPEALAAYRAMAQATAAQALASSRLTQATYAALSAVLKER